MSFDLKTWLKEIDLEVYQPALEAKGFTTIDRILAMSDDDFDAIEFNRKDGNQFESERLKLLKFKPFPPLGDSRRPRPSFDPSKLPLPLAITWQRLQEEMDKQEPIAAAWALRDAMEAGIKFTACLAVADVIQASTDDAAIQHVLGLLLKRTGLSLGDWNSLALASMKIDLPRKRLPELKDLFVQAGGKNTDLQVDTGSFITWRNKVFGHGVFKTDRDYYAIETLKWLPTLDALFKGLANVLADWQLEDTHHNAAWHDVTLPQDWENEEHRLDGDFSPLYLRRANTQELALGPLLSIRACTTCAKPHLFFFDRAIKGKSNGESSPYKSEFLEYFKGHHGFLKPDGEISNLAARMPAGWEWERTSYDQGEVADRLRAEFSTFEDEVVIPEAQIRVIEDQYARFPGNKGYVHLTGEQGAGKSWLVAAMATVAKDRGDDPVLPYFIRAGALADYRTFVSLLSDEAHNQLRWRTQEIQTKVGNLLDLKQQFSEFIAELMRANSKSTLTVVIDGLDELPDTPANEATITDFLPVAEKLPDGCRILLTSRNTLSPRIRGHLEALNKAGRFARVSLDPTSEVTRSVVRRWLMEKGGIQEKAQIDSILDHSDGVFLWARQFARAIQAGAFRDENLPEYRDFYPAYLEKLRARVGVDLYESVFLPTLLALTAARQPVPLSQLVAWGLPKDRLESSLFDLGDFLREERQIARFETIEDSDAPEYRYTLAHASLREYFVHDPITSSRLKEMHANIFSTLALTHRKQWRDIADSSTDLLQLADDSLLYALKYLPTHSALSGKTLPIDNDFVTAAWESATGLVGANPRYAKQSLLLWDSCIESSRINLKFAAGTEKDDLTYDLAAAKKNKSDEMLEMFMLGAAFQEYESVIEMCEDYPRDPSWVELAALCHERLAYIALEADHDKANAAAQYKLAEDKFKQLADEGIAAVQERVYELRLVATQLLDPLEAIDACTKMLSELIDKTTSILYGKALARRAELFATIDELELARDDFRAAQDILKKHEPESAGAKKLRLKLTVLKGRLQGKYFEAFGRVPVL